MASTKKWSDVITPVTQYKNGLMTPEHLEKLSDVALKVGTLSDLQTTAKNNLVSAVNEVVNMIVTSLNTPV